MTILKLRRTPKLIVPPEKRQIFENPSGWRWRIIVGVILVMMIGTGGFAYWALPQMLQPIWMANAALMHSSPDEVEANVLAQTRMPVLGSPDDVLTRVAEINSAGGKSFLTDPFTGEFFREVSPDELNAISDCPDCHYVMERFGRPPDKTIMLTFDDGPDFDYTTKMLDIMDREGIKGTFFVIGGNVIGAPEMMRRLIDSGQMIGNHTYNHVQDLGPLSDGEVSHELTTTDHLIRGNGYSTRLWRIPDADPERKILTVLKAQKLGYLQVDFNVDTEDWRYRDGVVPVPELDGRGKVILLHDSGGDRTSTAAMLPKLIAEAKAKGYTFSTVEPLLPPDYVPGKLSVQNLSDILAMIGSWAYSTIPPLLDGSMLVYGIWSIAMSVVYTGLALIQLRREKRRSRHRKKRRRHHTLLRVAVIVPAFKESVGLCKSLDSILASKYPLRKLEIIVVDDGSTDDTLEVALRYASEHPRARIKVLHQENGGKASAINHGLRFARCDVFVLMDGDTVFKPDTIRNLVNRFDDPKVGVVGGHVRVGNRNSILAWFQSAEFLKSLVIEGNVGDFCRSKFVAPGACCAWRWQAYLDIGEFTDITKAEDCDATIYAQKKGWLAVTENSAIAITEPPSTLKGFKKQRKRWGLGTLQALWKHRGMLFRPRYGMLGMWFMPYAVLQSLSTIVVMPLALYAFVIGVMFGDWSRRLLFLGISVSVQMVQMMIAVVVMREHPAHLLVVLLNPLTYAPLQSLILLVSIFFALKGRGSAYGWNKLERIGLGGGNRNRLVATVTRLVPKRTRREGSTEAA